MFRSLIATSVLLLLGGPPASGATLTITPDKAVYQVGEQIVLDVFGDAEGAVGFVIAGRILFDDTLAEYSTSEQDALTSFGGIEWFTSPLIGGPGFGDAFRQLFFNGAVPDGPLTASVTLTATSLGTLNYAWLTDGSDDSLSFFGLTDAPGGSLVIVPEPGTGFLLSVGLAAAAFLRRR